MSQKPLLPLRDVVLYPNMVIPLFVGRKKSIDALEAAEKTGNKILLVAQRSPLVDEPRVDDFYNIGCQAIILQKLTLSDGTIKLLVEGEKRVFISKIIDDDFFSAKFKILKEDTKSTPEAEVLGRSLINQFEQYVKLNAKFSVDLLASLSAVDNLSQLADMIAAHLLLDLNKKQELLEILSAEKRLNRLMTYIKHEIQLLNLEREISGRVKTQMDKTQRDYYLNQKIEAIQKELSKDGADGTCTEEKDLEEKIKSSGMPKEAEEKALAELKKFKLMSPMSAEATVSRNYLDCMIEIPWGKKSKISQDLKKAEQVLEKEHYGLEKVKERILEYLAVQKRVKKLRGPILCLVGPPGVGKTSLARSIANATGRKFIRMSLGGVRDEAEIRGHRRTYIGSMPGKIIQKITKSAVCNPLFLLDEIDKMAMDFRGDPGSALLEVLDPEQNAHFSDHYLEVDYDLSEVMFVATANSRDISPALLDRMEIINISGYTEDEKSHIFSRYLIPKQMLFHGLKKKELYLTQGAILDIIRYYTREAGVRNLERELSKICRKAVYELLTHSKKKSIAMTQRNLEKYLGVQRHRYSLAEEQNQLGHVTGLAWTETGGEILHIEVASVPGKGRATYTGSLGDVMQESIQAAMTVVRSRVHILGIDKDYFEKHNLHVHVPAGATPKDGPSAGIGMCAAIMSVVTGIPVHCDVAMTGEITLRGEVLPIGGLKEKLLAAHRGGIKTVIIPEQNRRDLKEIPKNIQKNLNIKPVKWIDEVVMMALTHGPTPLTDSDNETDPLPVSSLLPDLPEQQSRRRH